MKRDIDLIRKLMIAFEEVPPGKIATNAEQAGPMLVNLPLNTFGSNGSDVLEHVGLLIEADLIEGEFQLTGLEPELGYFIVRRVTWEGHDFLGSTRDGDVWNKTKNRLKAVGSWTFGLVLDIAKDEIKKRVGLLTIGGE